MLLQHRPRRLSFAIERTPRSIQVGLDMLDVEELNFRLPFTRNPAHIDDINGGAICRIFVAETKILMPEYFDDFANNLQRSWDWLDGKGGVASDGFVCIEAVAPGRPYLYINPLGRAYPHYVARLE